MIKLKNLEGCYPLAKEKFFYVLREILDCEGDFVPVMAARPSGVVCLSFIVRREET